ncbi:hypothetical protein RGR602_PC02207 (plasmid) [Rhizobium gallicum bv. gallicum R602sp]|uniref:Uncharacterized protein n=1 Tax=Rhizobium gallicum bv. gallicum R602sp TaxID=1041138 RepID=A0A0B4XGM0_9HYPH|nr:hypothetical protein RGR602_PC02207 [Rhizobium gallicum bv. gallicum R602sp]
MAPPMRFLNNTANMAHRDAGGGAIHSIKSGHRLLQECVPIFRLGDGSSLLGCIRQNLSPSIV